jgi:hypothetical protein
LDIFRRLLALFDRALSLDIHVGYNERCGKKLCPLRAVKGLIVQPGDEPGSHPDQPGSIDLGQRGALCILEVLFKHHEKSLGAPSISASPVYLLISITLNHSVINNDTQAKSNIK